MMIILVGMIIINSIITVLISTCKLWVLGLWPYFKGVDDISYHNFRDHDNFSTTFSRNDFDRLLRMHLKGYSNTRTQASDSYWYDQSSCSNSIAYQGYGYNQYGVDLEQPLKPYLPYYGSSSQSSQLTYSSYEQFFQPYSHYGNYHPDLYTCRMIDDDDFESPRHSTWNWLLYLYAC